MNINKPIVLIVDDVVENIKILAKGLKDEYSVIYAMDGNKALQLVEQDPQLDLILLDIMMPEMDGYEVIRRLKANPLTSKIPVIFLTAMIDEKDETKGLAMGAVDYIFKPINLAVVKARVSTHIKLKCYQENLEKLVEERTSELSAAKADLAKAHEMIRKGYIETIYRLTLSAELKDEVIGNHVKRMSHYAKTMAEALGQDKQFVDAIFHAAPMHDIGKAAISNSILIKPDSLTSEEWLTIKEHTIVGAKILEDSSSPFLRMAHDVALCHHERWDGSGYPNGLKGEEIPLAARIVKIIDQYDALRSKRPYKPPLSHEETMDIIVRGDERSKPEHFDPEVLAVFQKYADQLRQIFDKYQ